MGPWTRGVGRRVLVLGSGLGAEAIAYALCVAEVTAIDLDAEGRAVANVDIVLRGHRDMAGETEPTLIDLADGRGWLVANAAWPLFPEDGSVPDTPRPATVILEIDLQ